jgi:DNA repair protein RecN (Recombination protein N)
VLRELSVQNLATIEDARVELEPGFTAWTGETGAGKSLLLTALGLVTGGKASSDLVRAGKEEARAAAVFDLEDDRLRGEIEEILGGRVEDAQLIVTRRISAAGRSQAHANGLPVTAATLRKLGGRLIDIHGQHEGRALLEPERQRALLDAYGKLEAQARQVREAWQAHDTLLRRRRALVEANERRQREHALLSFERDELEALDPQEGEPAELASEAHRLANIAELQSATSAAYGALYEADGSVQDRVDQVARRLEPLAKAAPELAAIAADLDRIGDEVRDLARQVQRLNQGSEEDPERLEEVESRLARYRKLAARFRCAPEGLVAVRARVAAQLAAIDQADAKLAALDQPLA